MSSIIRNEIQQNCKKLGLSTNSTIREIDRIEMLLQQNRNYIAIHNETTRAKLLLARFDILPGDFDIIAAEVTSRFTSSMESLERKKPQHTVTKREPGRPKKNSGNETTDTEKTDPATPKQETRGRPKGSRNKKTLERERLIAEGKIKRDKNESVIFRRDNSHYEKCEGKETCIDEEIPFDIPSTWEWARASSLGAMIRGKGIKRTETVEHGFPCVRYGELYTSYNIVFSETKSFIPPALDEVCFHFSKGDVVFTLTGENKVDIAKAVAYNGELPVAAGGDMAFWTAHGMNPLYLVYYMASPYCIEQKRRTATGDIIVHISTNKVGNFLIPIPPLKEQERIVDLINIAFEYAETL